MYRKFEFSLQKSLISYFWRENSNILQDLFKNCLFLTQKFKLRLWKALIKIDFMSKNIDFWRKNSNILHFRTVDFWRQNSN